MAIDDPLNKFDQQYMQDEHELPAKLAKLATALAIPDGGIATGILTKVFDALFDRDSTKERLKAMWEMVCKEFEHVETTKASHEDVQKAIQLMFIYDSQQRDDAKRAYYVKLIGNALRCEEQIHNVASFIQTLEQLNERDIAVLKVINQVTNKDGDWNVPMSPAQTSRAVHPTTFTKRSGDLAFKIAETLGHAPPKGDITFNREPGYAACNRLQGFGLVHEVTSETRQPPFTNYCYRLSVLGVQLLMLLGEEVPNQKHYLGPV